MNYLSKLFHYNISKRNNTLTFKLNGYNNNSYYNKILDFITIVC